LLSPFLSSLLKLRRWRIKRNNPGLCEHFMEDHSGFHTHDSGALEKSAQIRRTEICLALGQALQELGRVAQKLLLGRVDGGIEAGGIAWRFPGLVDMMLRALMSAWLDPDRIDGERNPLVPKIP